MRQSVALRTSHIIGPDLPTMEFVQLVLNSQLLFLDMTITTIRVKSKVCLGCYSWEVLRVADGRRIKGKGFIGLYFCSLPLHLPVCHNVPVALVALRAPCIILGTNLAENAIVSLLQLPYFPYTHSSEPYVHYHLRLLSIKSMLAVCWQSHAQNITSYQLLRFDLFLSSGRLHVDQRFKNKTVICALKM